MTTLWRGATPTIARAIVVNAAQLGTYSQAKDSAKSMMGMQEGIKLHFVAAMISGLVTTIASMPVDIVKTRLQNQKVLFDSFLDRILTEHIDNIRSSEYKPFLVSTFSVEKYFLS